MVSSPRSCASPVLRDGSRPRGSVRAGALHARQPLRMTSASTAIDSTKLIQTLGSCSSANHCASFRPGRQGQVDVGRGQQADEQPVAARGGASAGSPCAAPSATAAPRPSCRPAAARCRRRRPPTGVRPGHPVEHGCSLRSHPPHREALGDVVAHEPDHQRARHDGEHAGRGQHAPVHAGGATRCASWWRRSAWR